jgi:hypothetical protein
MPPPAVFVGAIGADLDDQLRRYLLVGQRLGVAELAGPRRRQRRGPRVVDHRFGQVAQQQRQLAAPRRQQRGRVPDVAQPAGGIQPAHQQAVGSSRLPVIPARIASVVWRVRSLAQPRCPGRYRLSRPLMTTPSTPTGGS